MKPPPITLSGNVPTITDLDHEAIADELEGLTAQATIEWMFDQFGQNHYIACSFQKTSSVTAHLASQVNPDARFFYLDTDVLFPETYETRDRLAEALGIEFDRYHNLTLEEQAKQYGDELWKREPDACCGIRKVEPMRRALSSVDCWVAGVRRADSSSRAGSPKFAWDKKFGLWKLNPLADWSERDVWNYIHEHRLPYNPLHDRGYPSIGCTHCTQPVAPGGDLRDGRWAGVEKTECGIN
ncbi:MAG: phosphoadenylyl-sulfate reductase [Actinobacteria bacterium]|nr:phosphoadenylyl-sulfate reductase [Actinomycetota bacterium]MBS1883789.1 phosphoadenylyl-sulfate reductase [Actinomycetota bacterium]